MFVHDRLIADSPKPGSSEARKLGCRCSVLDNNRGKYPPYPPDGWWIVSDCPVHAKAK
jgi:hypothetical protein